MSIERLSVIIYESSSFGGCYDYAVQLHAHYRQHPQVASCHLLLPESTPNPNEGVELILLPDRLDRLSPWRSRVHFLYRHFVNPLHLLRRVRRAPASFVLFNDFEQLSSFFWVPLFFLLARQHRYGVFLHDPDRDDFPPSRVISGLSMWCMMSLMEVALYHEILPLRWYYNRSRIAFLNVPHGIYPLPSAEPKLLANLKSAFPVRADVMLLLGAIRDEKNYPMAIAALPTLPHLHLLIAGPAANSGVDVVALKALAAELGVASRIVWLDRFLSYAEMASCIAVCDLIWLNYAATFQSQSAIFNTVVVFQKKLLVADGDSAMARLVEQFDLGVLVAPDRPEAIVPGIQELLTKQNFQFEDYLGYASWYRHVALVITYLQHGEPSSDTENITTT